MFQTRLPVKASYDFGFSKILIFAYGSDTCNKCLCASKCFAGNLLNVFSCTGSKPKSLQTTPSPVPSNKGNTMLILINSLWKACSNDLRTFTFSCKQNNFLLHLNYVF